MQFSWWTYLLIKLNKSYIKLQASITPEPVQWEAVYQHKIMMIGGEALVFFLIMLWAIFQIQKSFKRELELARQQKNFLLSITHELKTPLASVRLGLETLEKHKLEEDLRKRVIGQAISETDRLNLLIEKILFSTRLEDHGLTLQLKQINLSKLIKETLLTPSQTIGKNHQLKMKIDPDVMIEIDDWAFKSIVINLYENALKYSPKGTSITIRLRDLGNSCLLSVEDEGEGISNDFKSKVFKRFYRIENEETRSVKGTGLGLYIVKSLVILHHATIVVEDNKPNGTRFKIDFKK
jgi:signal transduction histidine kinase